ncbi:MAG: NUDIX hydrolase [Candidatus Brocadiales bacterium]|nr:NUDIX hydrolase [Candidatus Bathyanammoxibius amoris]
MEKTLQSKMIYDGRRLRLYRDEVELPDGRHTFREVVSHPGAVAVVPVTEEGDVFLVKQFRYAIRSELYEIPAGIIEKGESPEQCAVRELREEAGLNAGKMEKLGQFYTSPGVMDELMHIYRATELTAPGYKPEEGIEVVKMKLGQAIDKIKTGEIADAKTICGIFWVVRGITQKEAH